MAKRVILSAKLDSAAVGDLREKLMGSVGDDVVLDGSGVEMLGGLCLELLLGARHLWAAGGKSLSIAPSSAELDDNLARFGLAAGHFAGEAPA